MVSSIVETPDVPRGLVEPNLRESQEAGPLTLSSI